MISIQVNCMTQLDRYELINEPWIGNYLADPMLLFPGIAGSKNLQPLYEKIARAIRSVDNKTLIFYQPVTWGGRITLLLSSKWRLVIFSSN